MNMNSFYTLGNAKASVARNFLLALLLKKGTSMTILGNAKALVARNFLGALLLKKGTIK